MSQENTAPSLDDGQSKRLFWACFIALIATAFGFIIRGTLLDEWAVQFGLTEVEKGQINGVGVWPMGVSIVLFSLVVDKIGYGRSMIFAFLGHVLYALIVISAPMVLAKEGASAEEVAAGQRAGYWMLYFGNLFFSLGNGVVEAVINPVVATLFSREKTKWLNILHAGWPGGLVLAGLLTIAMGSATDWRIKVGLIFLPVAAYTIMMLSCKFPINERVAGGGSYLDMLKELGIVGFLIVITLMVCEVLGNFFELSSMIQSIVILAVVGVYGAYVRSLGRPMLIFLMLIMIPLATTEIGTDGWITSLMRPQMERLNLDPTWILVYTSFIMMVLRFFAGPIVHKVSPLGLLAISAVIAAIGLTFLSHATGLMILVAATVYGFGKTFFWPTMLGVVSEQFPKGGALTLNATGGVGMLGVGVLGFPFIGLLQENISTYELQENHSAIHEEVTVKKQWLGIEYQAVDLDKVAGLSEEDQNVVTTATDSSKKEALGKMAVFPCIMLVCYLILIVYFKSKGGYDAKVLTEHDAVDEEFTGGVEGPVE